MYEPLTHEIDITRHFPPTVSDFEEFIEIGKVESTNFNRVRIDLLQLFGTRFIHSVDEVGIARWEKMLKLRRRATDDLEVRRMRVLAKINNRIPYTWRSLQQLLNSIFGKDNYQLDLDPQELVLELLLPYEQKYYGELVDILEPMIPLNIYMIIADGILKDMLQIVTGTYAWEFNNRVTGRFKTGSKPTAIINERIFIKEDMYSFETGARVSGRFRAGGAL